MVVEPKVFADGRGYFMEVFRANWLAERGPPATFVQQSESRSRYGTVRGLHYQLPPHAQTKLVRVIVGAILDVAVDIREGSPTFGRHVAVELSADTKRMLLVPRGFAHGFSVLSDYAIVNYMVDNYYAPHSERGISYCDPALGIDWRVDADEVELSARDTRNPPLAQAEVFPAGIALYDE